MTVPKPLGLLRSVWMVSVLVLMGIATSSSNTAVLAVSPPPERKMTKEYQDKDTSMLRSASTVDMAIDLQPPQQDHHRVLAPGDFDDLALLYQQATLPIEGTFEVDQNLVSMTFSNLVCREVYFSDITWTYSEPTAQTLQVQAAVLGVEATCSIDFTFTNSAPFIGGTGTGSATATASDAFSMYQLDFVATPSLNERPPQSVTLTDCTSDVSLDSFVLNDSSLPNFLSPLLGLARPILANRLSDWLCNLQEPVEDLATRILDLNDLLDPYLEENLENRNQDPLAPERNLVIDDNVQLVDFLGDPNATTITRALNEILDRASEQLNGESIDENTGETDLNVNILIRNQLLDEGGNFAVDWSSFSTGALYTLDNTDFGSVELNLLTVYVSNLDQFTSFDLLERIGNYTLSTSFAIPEISFDADFELVIQPPGVDSTFVQTFTAGVAISNIDISLAFLLAIDENRIETLLLGSVLDTATLLDCLLSFLFDAEIAVFSVGDLSINRPMVYGFDSPGFARVVPTVADTVYDMFRSILDEALPNLVENVVLDTVNTELEAYTNGAKGCPDVNYEEMTDFIDFRDLLLGPEESRKLGGSGEQPYGNLAAVAKGFLDGVLEADTDTGLSRVNGLVIDKWTEDMSGTEGSIVYDGNLIDIDGNVSSDVLNAELEMRVYNARIDGLNTIQEPLELLGPVNGQRTWLNNSAAIGSSDRPVRLSATLFFRLRTGDATEFIENEMELSLAASGLSVVAPIVAEFIEGVLLSYPIDDVLDFNCILASIREPELDERGIRRPGISKSLGLVAFELLVNRVDLGIECISCTSPRFEEISELLKQEPASQDVTDTVNSILDLISEFIGGEFLQNWIDRELAEAPRRCSASPLYEPGSNRTEYEPFAALETDKGAQRLLLALLTLCVCVMIIAYGIREGISRIVRKRNSEWLSTLPPKQILAIFRQQQKIDSLDKELDSQTKSLFKSEAVPVFVRYLIPVVMIGNAGLFLSGHFSNGGTITVIGNLGGEPVQLGDLFKFSIAGSVVDLWEAEGYALALLIAFFSGVWPYAKLGVTMALWYLPTKKVSVSRRGRYLVTLDALSKWSMVDVFVIIISLVAYRKTILSPVLSYIPEDLYSLDLLVIPLWGLYANLLAQLVAQVTSTYVIHYHRRVVEVATKQKIEEQQTAHDNSDGSSAVSPSPKSESVSRQPTVLRNHKFYRIDQGIDEVLGVKRGVTLTMLVLSGIAVLFYFVGCSIKAFSLETLGLFGLLIASGRGFEEATEEYSVFGVASFLMDQAQLLGTSSDTLGHFLLASVLVITVLIVPCVQVGVMIFQWFYPMGPVFRNRVLTAIEILQAWQYSEVFLVALLIGTMQAGQISSLIVKQFCEGLNSTFATLEYYGILDEEDATCFNQEARVKGGFYMLVFGAIILAVLETFVITATLHWQRDTTPNARSAMVDRNATQLSADGHDIEEVIEKIRPPPILFTDRFRFLLAPEEYMA